ncbi:helix-turn-helix domain-containing protein [Leucobacter insecticola]|uniref:Helix-turn-helix domain-containing protein n=1 Tax=Leucobacter insecticola TaxID=2714934 RepID=A0A6G8FIC7_9MICO|nr:helix-turn-helix domain-containing protein [Leucobacter insecticola]QIM16039.1 helix-turn-helix domain-containing protein [Leucobacter insecticola]
MVKRLIAEPRDEYEARIAARHERIRELRADGLSMRAIAAELDVSVGTVHYALNKVAA